jgi:hypothetical protein
MGGVLNTSMGIQGPLVSARRVVRRRVQARRYGCEALLAGQEAERLWALAWSCLWLPRVALGGAERLSPSVRDGGVVEEGASVDAGFLMDELIDGGVATFSI